MKRQLPKNIILIILTACFLLLALGVSLVSYSIVLNKKPTAPTVPNKPQDIEENPELTYVERIAKSYTCTFYDDSYHIITLEKDCTFVLKNRGVVLEKGSFTVQADGTINLTLFGEKYLLKPDLLKSLMLMVAVPIGDYTEYSNQVGEFVYKLRLYNEGYARLFLEGNTFNVYGSYGVDGEKCTVTFLNEKTLFALYKENGSNRFKDYSQYERNFYLGDYECSFMNNATLTLYEGSFRIHNGNTLFEGDSYELDDDELCLYIGGTKLFIDIYSDNCKRASLKDITEGEGETYLYYSKDYNEDYYFTFYSTNGTYKMTSTSMGYTLYGYYKFFSQNRYYVMCLKNSAMVVIENGKLYLASEYVEDTREKFSFENNDGVCNYELSVSSDGTFTLVRKTQNITGDEHKGTYTINPYGIVLSNSFYGIFKDKIVVLDYENHLFALVKYYQYTDYNGKNYYLKQIAVNNDTDEFVLSSSFDSQEFARATFDKNNLKEGFRFLGNNEDELIWVSGDIFVYVESLLGKYYYNDSGIDYLLLLKDLSYELSINGYQEKGFYNIIDGQLILDNETYVTLASNRFSFTKDRITKVECTLPNMIVKGEDVKLSEYTITLHTLLGNVYHTSLDKVSVEKLRTDIAGDFECRIVFRDYTYMHSYKVIEESPSYLAVVNLPDTVNFGEGINLSNAVVNVISDFGRVMFSSAIREDMFVDLDLSSIGSKSSILCYMGLTYTYYYTVVSDVYDVEIVGLTMSKNVFSVGEEIDLTGARIRIRTNLNTFRYERVTLDMLVGFSTANACYGVFIVEYNGMRYVGSSYIVKSIPRSYELTVDVVLSTVAGVESDIQYMTNAYFVALSDGKYRFESKSQYGIRAYLYDENMTLLAYDYAGSENSVDFVIEYSLKQGEMVRLYYRVDSDSDEEIEIIATRIG